MDYPSETEPQLLPCSDGMSEICGSAPAMYANVPAEVIREVVNKHHGLRSDSVSLPELVTTGASAAAAAAATTTTAEAKASETEEERDENGCLWVAAAIPPTTTEESSVTSDDRLSPHSMAHMGAPPPPPPATLPPPTTIGDGLTDGFTHIADKFYDGNDGYDDDNAADVRRYDAATTIKTSGDVPN